MKRWLVIGTLATALGACHLLIGLDKFENTSGAGGSGGTSSPNGIGGAAGAAGLGGSAGSGGAPMCAPTPTPMGAMCPSFCVNGCAGGTCEIRCDTFQECLNQSILCPEGLHCRVLCTDFDSCKYATIYCPASFSCSLECSECTACESAEFHCNDGPCLIHCENCGSTCEGTQQLCGPNRCTRSCVAADEPAQVNCDQSCECQDDCGTSSGGAGGTAAQ